MVEFDGFFERSLEDGLELRAPCGRAGHHRPQVALKHFAAVLFDKELAEIAPDLVGITDLESVRVAVLRIDDGDQVFAAGAGEHFFFGEIGLLIAEHDSESFVEPFHVRHAMGVEDGLILMDDGVADLVAEEFAVIELHLVDFRSDVNNIAGGQGDCADASGAHVRHEPAEVAPIRGEDDGHSLGGIELQRLFRGADVAVDFAVSGWGGCACRDVDIGAGEVDGIVTGLPGRPGEEWAPGEGGHEQGEERQAEASSEQSHGGYDKHK